MSMHGARGSEPIAQASGIALRVDGVPVGVPRSQINFRPQFGANKSVVDDPTPGSEKTNLGLQLLGDRILLGVALAVDHVALGVGGTIQVVPTVTGSKRLSVREILGVANTLVGAGDLTMTFGTPADPTDHSGFGGGLNPLPGAYWRMGEADGRPWLSSSASFDKLILTSTSATLFTTALVDWYIFGSILNPE